ncbi:MAG TPA: 30S ribosomal protein THX [Mucilaginibacter sp.]|jgi:30S ribosomal protein S31|nr:30S ribosomal protein THX [Mucilaginibacter sp.]
MGRGDKKTGKGKLAMGSFGKTRPHKQPKKVEEVKPEKK